MRRAAKRDTNETEIVSTLRKCGASVVRLNDKGAPDLLIGWASPTGPRMALIECKTAKGRLTPDQLAWALSWRGPPVCICRSVDDALAVLQGEGD